VTLSLPEDPVLQERRLQLVVEVARELVRMEHQTRQRQVPPGQLPVME
jgi:hypothetical protein